MGVFPPSWVSLAHCDQDSRSSLRPTGCLFGGRLQLFEGVTHVAMQLTLPIEGPVDDAGPRGQPLDVVGLGHTRAVVDRFKPIGPFGRLPAAFLRGEDELLPGFRGNNPAVTGPL